MKANTGKRPVMMTSQRRPIRRNGHSGRGIRGPLRAAAREAGRKAGREVGREAGRQTAHSSADCKAVFRTTRNELPLQAPTGRTWARSAGKPSACGGGSGCIGGSNRSGVVGLDPHDDSGSDSGSLVEIDPRLHARILLT
jgi:hypothetical protein